jgi:hypothetical protein
MNATKRNGSSCFKIDARRKKIDEQICAEAYGYEAKHSFMFEHRRPDPKTKSRCTT